MMLPTASVDAASRRAAWQAYLGEIPDPFVATNAAACLAKILARPDLGGQAAPKNCPPLAVDDGERQVASLLLPKAPTAQGRYLPIESFRDEPESWLAGALPPARIFRSSGTTQAARARSLFSQKGLELYRLGSVACFFQVLRDLLGAAPWDVTGISLIPDPISGWPESSLATMVGWIGEVSDVHFAEAGDLSRLIADGKPVWLFGTAFHFVQALDDGEAVLLPKGSVVIETGGTKGRTRAVERDELYAMIASGFGVPRSHIVSEYGMSELASQAYDWDRGDGERAFRFPSWCQPFVVRGPGDTALAGEGLLAIDDPLRLDFPYAIRTEDMALLQRDGRFQLLGRAPDAPLKGCSLAAEGLGEEAAPAGATTSPRPPRQDDGRSPQAQKEGDFARFDALRVAREADRLAATLRGYLTSKAARLALTQELGSAAAAAGALDDVLASLPTTTAAWTACARAAAGNEAQLARRWLFILPSNHALVGVYPLAMAQLWGLDVLVRVPDALSRPDGFLMGLVTTLRETCQAELATVSGSFIIEAEGVVAAPAAQRALLVYGEDATIARLSNAWPGSVVGFGDHLSLAVLDGSTTSDELWTAVSRDSLVTAQRGCLSTRLTLVRVDHDQDIGSLASALQRTAREFWQAPVPKTARLALERSAWAARREGFQPVAPTDPSTPLVLTLDTDFSSLSQLSLARLIAQRAFTLPVVFVRENSQQLFAKVISERLIELKMSLTLSSNSAQLAASLQSLLMNYDQKHLSFSRLGRVNAPLWDGLHQGRALFAPFFA